jgi:hypothetical protein
MKKNKLETAKSLARAHFELEPDIRRIHLIEPLNDQDPNDPIKLLEVVEGTIERGIEPIGFTADPARGIEYPTIVVEISPAEFNAIQDGKLGYRDWSIGEELFAS